MTDTPLPPVSESGEPVPISPPVNSDLTHKLAVEALGTAILVLIGCGAVVFGYDILNRGGGPTVSTVTTVALAFGFVVALLIYAFGRASGGHFNPAVSVGAAISGRMPWVEAGYYAAAQVVGGIVGATVLWVIAQGFSAYSSTRLGLGANRYGGPGGPTWWSAFLIEMVLTFIFVLVILAVTDKRNMEFAAVAPLVIGLTLAVAHFAAIPVTGTGVNPARSIGPALFSGAGALKDLWLFIVAPLVGGAAAGLAHPALFGRAEPALAGSGFNLNSFARSRPRRSEPAPEAYPGYGGYQAGQGYQGAPGTQATQTVPGYQGAPGYSAYQGGTQTGQQTVPSWQQPVAPAAEGELPVYEQDGWRWDYASQSWKPIDQPAPPAAPGGPGAPGATGTFGGAHTGEPPQANDETTRIVPPAE